MAAEIEVPMLEDWMEFEIGQYGSLRVLNYLRSRPYEFSGRDGALTPNVWHQVSQIVAGLSNREINPKAMSLVLTFLLPVDVAANLMGYLRDIPNVEPNASYILNKFDPNTLTDVDKTYPVALAVTMELEATLKAVATFGFDKVEGFGSMPLTFNNYFGYLNALRPEIAIDIGARVVGVLDVPVTVTEYQQYMERYGRFLLKSSATAILDGGEYPKPDVSTAYAIGVGLNHELSNRILNEDAPVAWESIDRYFNFLENISKDVAIMTLRNLIRSYENVVVVSKHPSFQKFTQQQRNLILD